MKMTIGELIFTGVVITWLLDMFYGMIFVDNDKTNWPCIIGFLFVPFIPIIALACGL